MKFTKFALPFALCSVFAAAGCAADSTEITDSSQDELRAEQIFCAIWDCRQEWHKLGQTEVNGIFGDRDTIYIDRDEGRFSRIQLRIRGRGAVTVRDLEVTFRNGERFYADEDFDLDGNGDRTRTINLPGNRRAIRKVELKASRSGIFFGGDDNDGPSFPFPFPLPNPDEEIFVELWAKR
jgi:hypothetical protein